MKKYTKLIIRIRPYLNVALVKRSLQLWKNWRTMTWAIQGNLHQIKQKKVFSSVRNVTKRSGTGFIINNTPVQQKHKPKQKCPKCYKILHSIDFLRNHEAQCHVTVNEVIRFEARLKGYEKNQKQPQLFCECTAQQELGLYGFHDRCGWNGGILHFIHSSSSWFSGLNEMEETRAKKA